jgi:hypothetical protein
MPSLKGIFQAVLIGIIIYAITNVIIEPFFFEKPKVDVTEITIGNPYHRYPMFYNQGNKVIANVTVGNSGRAIAKNCYIHFFSNGLGRGDDLTSGPFSLEPGDRKTRTFDTSVKDKWNTPGLINSTAWVECENCRSDNQTKSISAGFPVMEALY